MTENLQQLNWKQNGTAISIELLTESGTINFALDTRLVHHLVANSPKVVIFHIELPGKPEKAYIVDFEGIKSIPSYKSALTVRTGKSKDDNSLEKEFTELGKFCIARGESHYNQHISENGWQRTRKYFNIYDSNEVSFKTKLFSDKIAKEKAEKAVQKKKPEDTKPPKKQSKLSQCVACGEVIPSMPICPYCGAKQ